MSTEDPEETRFQRTAERYSWSARPARYRLLVALGGLLAYFAAYGWLLAGGSYTLMAGSLLTMPMLIGLLAFGRLREDSHDAGRPASGRRLAIAWAETHRRPPARPPDAWLERLQGLLEGRHQLPATKLAYRSGRSRRAARRNPCGS